MFRRKSDIYAMAVAIGLGVTTSLLPGITREAFAFGHGGGFGGGHFGGFHGGGFGGGHFGGFHGGHFGGGHFGGFHGGRFGAGHFGGGHFGRGHFGGGHFAHGGAGGHFAHGGAGGRFAHGGAGGRFAHGGAGGRFAHGGAGGRFAHGGAGGRFAHGGAGGPFGNGARFGGRATFAGNRVGQFATFHGIHGLDPQGFNRNGFGNMQGWNRWGSNNWGFGWNNWGYGSGYWAGPVFWPFFYGDVLTFAMWPYTYYDPFYLYGPSFLLSSILWPGPSLCPLYGYCPYYAYNDVYNPYYSDYGYNDYSLFDVYGYPPDEQYYTAYYHGRYHHRRHHHHHRYARRVSPAAAPAPADAAATCGGLAPGVTQLPIDRIERTIHATDDQMKMLDQLRTASGQANTILIAACPTSVPLTPVSRLDAVSGRLHAMIQAVDVLRGPLTVFYDSLDDSQKSELAAFAGRAPRNGANIAVKEAPAHDLAALCQKQAQSFTLLPVERIDDVLKPTAEQQTAFDTLKTASSAAAKGLDASCPSDAPQTMEGRLNAVSMRLQALEDAANAVRPALKTFYASLSDEQKARFNVIGGVNMAATPQGATPTGAGP